VDGFEECRNYFIFSNTVPNPSTVVFRRAIFERVVGADESVRMSGDWKLWVAMALTGRMAYLSEPLNYHRSHDASARSEGRKEELDAVESLQVIRWILNQVTLADVVLERICQGRIGFRVPAVPSIRVPCGLKVTRLKNVMDA
jgi:hypothetical protein